MDDTRDSDSSERGQSASLGVILVFAVVVGGLTLVAFFGGLAINDTENELSTSRAQKVMTQFDSQVALVALGDTDSRQVELTEGERGEYELRPDAGWVNVSVTNVSTGNVTTVMNESMGAVVYDNGRAQIAYQGGGVWRDSTVGDAIMVSPPEFHYRDATLTFPLIVVDQGSDVGGRTTISRLRTNQTFPNATLDQQFVNPLDQGRVNVTIQSDYYRAWGRFFERRTDGQVKYDDAKQRATVTLTVPLGPRTIEDAIASTSAGGEIVLTGTAPRSDSYNSSDGDGYSGDDHGNGTVRTAGDITIGGDSSINGSVTSGGSIDFDGGGDNEYELKGDAKYTDTISPSKTNQLDKRVEGEVTQINGVNGDPPITGYVEERVTDSKEDGTDLGVLDSSKTLDAGEYYADKIALDGDTLTINASAGNVTIGVENSVQLNNSARIEVDGTHDVRFYLKGETKTKGQFSYNPNGRDKIDEYHLVVDDSEIVTLNGNENSTQVWFYGGDNVIMGAENSKTVGVIYAPGGVGDESTFLAGGDTDHYGGVVASYVYIENKGAVHYDRALKNERTVPKRQDIVRLTYLHVSTNRIAVEG